MIGIYKITSPTKKIYIGQSINIEQRFYMYKRNHCKKQVRLYNSLKKHGSEKHNFEIIIECEISELNDKERYYQDLYSVTSDKGLNCSLTKSSDRSGKLSIETINKRNKSFANNFKIKKDIRNLYFEKERAKLPSFEETSEKVLQLIKISTKGKICKKIGISRNTLYKRLRDSSSWKTSEIYVVEGWRV